MTAFGQCAYPGHQPAAAPMWRQDPHEVDTSRRRHIEDPDEYKAGKEAGDAARRDQQQGGGKLRLWLSRLGIATAALPALTVVPVRVLSLGALVAVGLALANRTEPASGPVGRRGQTTPAKAETKYERDEFDPPARKLTADLPDEQVDGWREGER